MATPRNAPVKRATTAKRNSDKKKEDAKPGDPNFDWAAIYPQGTQLFKYTSQDGFVVKLPVYDDPGEGEIFGLMLLNKSETDLLIYVMRQHITTHAIDPDGALLVTFQALKQMKAPGVIETLLKAWPEASGKELGKS